MLAMRLRCRTGKANVKSTYQVKDCWSEIYEKNYYLSKVENYWTKEHY